MEIDTLQYFPILGILESKGFYKMKTKRAKNHSYSTVGFFNENWNSWTALSLICFSVDIFVVFSVILKQRNIPEAKSSVTLSFIA